MAVEFEPGLEGVHVVEARLLASADMADRVQMVGNLLRASRALSGLPENISYIAGIVVDEMSNHEVDEMDVSVLAPPDSADGQEEVHTFYVNDADSQGRMAGILLGIDDKGAKSRGVLGNIVVQAIDHDGIMTPRKHLGLHFDIATILEPDGSEPDGRAAFAASIFVPRFALGKNVQPSGVEWDNYLFGKDALTWSRLTVENLYGAIGQIAER